MTMLDAFQTDAFNVVSMTSALNKVPYLPTFLGSMGIFNQMGITTKQAVVEEKHGHLSLVNTSARGTTVETRKRTPREARSFLVPHLALTDDVMAEDVQDVRAFGSETAIQTVAAEVLDKQVGLRNDIEATKEYHRIGAIQGIVLDGDATTEIYNFFTEFGGLTEIEVDFVMATATKKASCAAVIRAIQDALGMTPFTGVVGLAGDNWWNEFVSSAEVESAFERWQDGHFLRTSQMGPEHFTGPGGQNGFSFAAIDFYNYRGKIGDVDFVDPDVCRFFPVGVPDLFKEVYAPADYIETVNTRGLAYYSKQERMNLDKGITIEVQSNPFIHPTRPAALIKGTKT